jgi:hypothetical protein
LRNWGFLLAHGCPSFGVVRHFTRASRLEELAIARRSGRISFTPLPMQRIAGCLVTARATTHEQSKSIRA